MKTNKDQEILEGIQKHDHKIINSFYKSNLHKIEKLVINSGGCSNKALDIFQEAMIILYRKLKNNDLILQCRLSTYFYSICKHLWLDEVKKRNRIFTKTKYPPIDHRLEEPEAEYKNEIYEIFDRHFDELSEDCQKILEMHFHKRSIEEIKELMGYSNSHYIMDKKYRCKKSLINRILNDPKYKKLVHESKREVKQIS